MSTKFDPYEYVSVIVPGTALLTVAMLASPELRALFGKNGIEIGGLGLFLVIAFVFGQVVQAVGNLLEKIEQRICREQISDRVLRPDQTTIAPSQRERLGRHLKQRLGVDINELSPQAWTAVRREMYAIVKAAKATERIDGFNRTYGLNRGLAAALLASVVLPLTAMEISHAATWVYVLGLLAAAFLTFQRMRRFSEHYARELAVEFIRLCDVPNTIAPTAKHAQPTRNAA
jgi:hypothetical protein